MIASSRPHRDQPHRGQEGGLEPKTGLSRHERRLDFVARRRAVLGVAGVATAAVVAVVVWAPWNDDSSSDAETTEPGTGTEIPGDTDAEQPVTIAPNAEFIVRTADDSGEGSLRAAITEANALSGPVLITFDSVDGPFADPQVITLSTPLPIITGAVTIDGYIPDRLWVATGVTVNGSGQHRVFEVDASGELVLRSLTVADGAAADGAGILNRGRLTLSGVTLVGNVADGDGGGLANVEGVATVINSTFTRNRAEDGGGVANVDDGRATIVNATFSDNSADRGGGLYSDSGLLVSNTILANSLDGGDCVSDGDFESASTNNLIEDNDGCGEPISTADPALADLNYYNGPVQTLPLGSGSPAINLGSNEAAVDEHGQTLAWDQRGNGDPRFVAGYTDIGAFEHQAFPELTVDTVDDVALRGCTKAGQGDCPLRAAIELANATPEPDVIVFDPQVFGDRTTIRLDDSLPEVTADLTLDASDASPVTVVGSELPAAPGLDLQLIDVTVE